MCVSCATEGACVSCATEGVVCVVCDGGVRVCVVCGGGCGVWLFDAHQASDEGYAVELLACELVGFVVGVVGDDEDVVVVGSPLDALDEWSLYGVEDIDFVPLEEEIGQRYALAGDEVSGAVCGEHGVACDADHEVGALECGYDIALAVVFHDGYVACECASHGRDGDEGNALAAALWGVVGCLDRMVVVCGLEHGALASEEPMCINIEL